MAGGCRDDQHWDDLLNECISCDIVCDQANVRNRCTSYCESARCKARPGHDYDGLLKICVRCADVCGEHPAECSQHCKTATTPATTKRLLVEVTSRVHNPRGLSVPTALENSTILLYSLLALCMVLLFTSLALALVVLLRNARAKASKSGPRKVKESVIQVGQEEDHRPKSSKDSAAQSTEREPSYDSSPTETCVCVHCFPDLKAPSQANDRPAKASFSFYQQAVLHRGPLWTEENLHHTRLEVQEEAAVG